jgi:hypothetical protein
MVLGKLICGAWLLHLPRAFNIKATILKSFERFSNNVGRYMFRRKPAAMPKQQSSASQIDTPISLYPAAILGSAMVARGEIGFLISSVAENKGLWLNPVDKNSRDLKSNSDIFITVTWAIFLCTFIGPIAVGLIVRRVKRLEKTTGSGRRDVLGKWRLE